MKLYKLLIQVLAILGVLLFAACEEDDFFNNSGSTDVKNLNVALDGYFAYDAPDLKLATLTFAQGNEGQVSEAKMETKFNDGGWQSAEQAISIPGELQLSLNDFLALNEVTFEGVIAGDFAEFSWILDDAFRGGITSVPIICSTDIVLTQDSVNLYLATDSLSGSIPFEFDVEGPATIKSVDVWVSLNESDSIMLKSITEWPAKEEISLGNLLDVFNLPQDSLALEDEITFYYLLNSNVTCPSASNIVATYDCISDLSGMVAYKTSNIFCDMDTTLVDTLAITNTGKRTYIFDDFSFGAYTHCYRLPPDRWNWGSLQLHDFCNDISIEGSDDFKDMGWELAVENVSGSVLTLSWTNDFGEHVTVELTRLDEADWAPLY